MDQTLIRVQLALSGQDMSCSLCPKTTLPEPRFISITSCPLSISVFTENRVNSDDSKYDSITWKRISNSKINQDWK
ncbi:hypothetical protein LWI28_011817 [Acer negundo]|uniref:Uncharacterized protein n=1 Tax=Acer negundo TaxID=4023 RepID=A0AAD5IEP5_ACENE|nr:hypothetical protein LWI28_011817 [Acer negundo]